MAKGTDTAAALTSKLVEATGKKAKLYESYIDPVKKAYKAARDEDLPDHVVANMAICMSNLQEEYRGNAVKTNLKEDTYTDAISTLQRHGFKIIAALLPSLIAEELFSVQAMDRRRGEAYYLNYEYADSKAGVTAGGSMIGAKVGQSSTTYKYSSDDDYYTAKTGDGTETNFTWTARYAPVRASSVTITASDGSSTMTVTDDGDGNLVGDVGSGNNTIAYTTGAVDVTFVSAVANNGAITFTYRYDWERMSASDATGVPAINIDVETIDLTARDRMLRARWLIGAAYDLEKVHGRSAQSDLLTALVAEIRHEIDAEILAGVLSDAATNGATTVTFDDSPPSTYYGKYEYYKELIFTLESASEQIFQATKRGMGNFIVTGRSLMAILAGMDDFEPSVKLGTQPPSGPHRAGTFRGRWTVYRNPFYAADRFLIGYKGDGWLNAGVVYAPYLPAFTTPPVALDDLRYRAGCLTSYAWSMINSLFYVAGTLV